MEKRKGLFTEASLVRAVVVNVERWISQVGMAISLGDAPLSPLYAGSGRVKVTTAGGLPISGVIQLGQLAEWLEDSMVRLLKVLALWCLFSVADGTNRVLSLHVFKKTGWRFTSFDSLLGFIKLKPADVMLFEATSEDVSEDDGELESLLAQERAKIWGAGQTEAAKRAVMAKSGHGRYSDASPILNAVDRHQRTR